jgi:flagellar biosynthesis/type III secretory pathway M-ring protein FliF/YscJ
MIPSSVFPPPAPWLSVRQVVTAVLGISAGCAILWLVADSPRLEETELLGGTVLPSSELALMEAAFDRAQLTGYRTDGGRVYVPRDRQSSFMRALVDAEALPREFGGSLRRALESDSPWQSRSVQAERLRVAMQEELSLVICSMPGIERAAVLYDTAEQSRGPERKPVTTASVNVCTQADVTLDPTRVQAIRILVAASIAGLEAERVAVTDLRSGRVYTGPLETIATPHASDPAIARLLAQEQYLASKIRASLSFVQGVIVDVTITPQRV